MGRSMFLSTLGLYNYNNTLFDNMVTPDEIDKNTLINNILMETAELELIYTDFDMMKFAIGEWSKRRLRAWQRMAEVLYNDYDPFINIKRDEERTITQSRDLANSLNSVVTDRGSSNNESTSNIRSTGETETSNNINTTVSGTGNNSTIHNVNGWDDNSTEGVQKDTTTTSSSERSTTATTESGDVTNDNTTNTTTEGSIYSNNETRRNDSGTDTGTITTHEKYHVEGDSAITDAQDVLKKEIEVRNQYEIYNYIINDFKNRFCLLVY